MNDVKRPDAEVLGLDNVRLELAIAGLGNRVLAAFLDHVMAGILMCLFVVAISAVGAGRDAGPWFAVVLLVVCFLVTWGLFAVVEIVMGGQTPGKRAMELHVVSSQGGAASVGALVVRNLLRVVDLWVGVLFMAADPKARRIGDRLAGTLVVHARRPRARLILGRTPETWGGREIAVVESFVERAPLLETERAARMAHRILLWVARDAPGMLDRDDPDQDPVVRVRLAFRVESL